MLMESFPTIPQQPMTMYPTPEALKGAPSSLVLNKVRSTSESSFPEEEKRNVYSPDRVGFTIRPEGLEFLPQGWITSSPNHPVVSTGPSNMSIHPSTSIPSSPLPAMFPSAPFLQSMTTQAYFPSGSSLAMGMVPPPKSRTAPPPSSTGPTVVSATTNGPVPSRLPHRNSHQMSAGPQGSILLPPHAHASSPPTPIMMSLPPAEFYLTSVEFFLKQEPCRVQLRSKPEKSYMVRPPPKLEIRGQLDFNTDFIRCVLIDGDTKREILSPMVKLLDGDRIHLNQPRCFLNGIATFSMLRIMVKPTSLHEHNGKLRFRFDLLRHTIQGLVLLGSAQTNKNMTLYSNYTQMKPEEKREYMASNPKRKRVSFTSTMSLNAKLKLAENMNASSHGTTELNSPLSNEGSSGSLEDDVASGGNGEEEEDDDDHEHHSHDDDDHMDSGTEEEAMDGMKGHNMSHGNADSHSPTTEAQDIVAFRGPAAGIVDSEPK